MVAVFVNALLPCGRLAKQLSILSPETGTVK